MAEPFRIGIAGLGTVGTGVVKIIQDNGEVLAQRAGCPIEIVSVSARDKAKDRGVDLSSYTWIDNPEGLADSNTLNAVIELMGGEDDPAFSLAKKSLEKGLHVVTANKALLAHHGFELAKIADANEACIGYEAAVAGGIPIIKALREGFAANEIKAVYGILNGTCNYILTAMRETGRDFEDILKEAQEQGYAEADPSFDIDGVDAGHKLCLLTALAFGTKPDFKELRINGIRDVTPADIEFAQELGYKIKLLGISKNYNGKVSQTVEPCLVPANSPIGAVEDVYNAVAVEGDFVDTPLLTGRGAGEGPTASSVVADIVDLARGYRTPVFGIPANDLRDPDWIDLGETENRFYLRLTVLDKPGVIADVSAILRDHSISIESLIQHGRDPDQPVAMIMVTHEVKRKEMDAACDKIRNLDVSVENPYLMRIEEL